MFTYGSCSPYALVLCIEQYLRPPQHGVHWRVHLALLLAAVGSLGWILFSAAAGWEVIQAYVYNQSSMYGYLGVWIWVANIAFFGWTWWRISLFQNRG